MAKFKKKRHFRRNKSYRRRHKDRRIPIIATAGAVGSFFVPRTPEQMSAGQWVVNTFQGKEPNLMSANTQSGNGALDFTADLLSQYVGYDFRNNSWGIPTASVVLIGSALGSKLVNRFGGNALSKVPFVGKYIKF